MTELMTPEIRDAIDKQLTGVVAGRLKEVLAQAEVDGRRVKELTASEALVKAENNDLRSKVKSAEHIEAENRRLNLLEQTLKMKEELLKLREQHCQQRVDELRNMMDTVFRSNRIGYNLNFDLPNPHKQYPSDTYSDRLPMGGSLDVKNEGGKG